MTDKLINLVLKGIFSVTSFVLHVVWFSVWWFLPIPDKTNLLTNLVSLEAIFIGLLVGIQQITHHEAIKQHLKKGKK